MQEDFVLQWKFHGGYIPNSLEAVSRDDTFADVTLVSDDFVAFNANKFVLSFFKGGLIFIGIFYIESLQIMRQRRNKLIL